VSALSAVVRVSGGAREVLSLTPAGDLSSMSTALVETALARAKPTDGVHRLTVDGSDVSLARLARHEETVVLLRVVRDGKDAVRVTSMIVSHGAGANQSDVDRRLEPVLAEVVARAGQEIPVGQSRDLDIVLA
jgi:hypothetical protein